MKFVSSATTKNYPMSSVKNIYKKKNKKNS